MQWGPHLEAHEGATELHPALGRHPKCTLNMVLALTSNVVEEEWVLLFHTPKYQGHNFYPLTMRGKPLQPTAAKGGP